MGSSPLTRGKRRASDCPVVISGLIPAHAGKTQYPAKRREGGQAHPRSRGENGLSLGARGLGGGSSPLTRGKHVPEAWAAKENGLIPAHAGKTTALGLCPRPHEAHPRSRGENTFGARIAATAAGSSPLTRGKLDRDVCEGVGCGLIPAHAGKTIGVKPSISSEAAHPRSRGENRGSVFSVISVFGSSPLTRGKPPSKPPNG